VSPARVADGFGKLDHRELAGIAEVHRADESAGGLHQAQEAFDQVVYVAEEAPLGAVAVELDRLVLQRGNVEVGDYASVVRVHARPVGVEDAGDLDVHAVLAVVVEGQRFGAARTFALAAAWGDRVHVARGAFGLRVL
jgi:hypothetical protein